MASNEDFDWTQVGKSPTTKNKEVQKEETTPPSETRAPPTSNVELPKIKRTKQPTDDVRHAKINEIEANLAQLKTEFNTMLGRFEEHVMNEPNLITPETRTKILLFLKGCRRKNKAIFNKDMWDLIHELETIFQ